MHYLHCCALLGGVMTATSAYAQTLPPRSLVEEPQQGATPRPVEEREALPTVQGCCAPADDASPAETREAPSLEAPQAPQLEPLPAPAPARTGPFLPVPIDDPLAFDPERDPILALAEGTTSQEDFRQAISAAVLRHPSLSEVRADRAEAEAIRDEARMLEYPVIDFSLNHFRTVAREFSNDPQNVLERSRPRDRTDALLRGTLPVIDFGRAQYRIRAGNDRIAAAESNIEASAQIVARSAIVAWYQVFTYRALVSLANVFVANHEDLRRALVERIDAGASSPADLVQYDSYKTSALSQLAELQQQLGSAEAQYRLFVGAPPPANLGRAPAAEALSLSLDFLLASVQSQAEVERARRLASAIAYEAKAVRSQEFPSVSVGVDAGRYGVFETAKDYDIRASVTLSHRMFGGAEQRTEQAMARAARAQATYDRVLAEAERDAEIAWVEMKTLHESAMALRENYIASSKLRDVTIERFRYSRGTLFDVMNVQTNFFNTAVRYLTTLSESDISRYNVLVEASRLMTSLNIDSIEASQP